MMPLSELADAIAKHMAALPAQSNGQIRGIPDERTIRYYTTLGLLDRPLQMRGRTALYGAKHAAQVIAIKRLQTTGKSLADIAAMWGQIDDVQLQAISGVAFERQVMVAAKPAFWRKPVEPVVPAPHLPNAEALVKIILGPGIEVVLSDHRGHLDVANIIAAAAPLLHELQRQRNA
jgi:DNA-binding transcriptional MerR regulator